MKIYSFFSLHNEKRKPFKLDDTILDRVIPLICIDIDGTLVGSTGQVTDAVWRAADVALSRGQHLALSTARGVLGSSWDMAKRLNPDGWHVFHAGGAIAHTGSGDIKTNRLSTEQVQAAKRSGKANNWVTEFYSATDYTVDSDAPLAVAHAELTGIPHCRRTTDQLKDSSEIVRVQYVIEENQIESAVKVGVELGLHASAATSPSIPNAGFVSLTAPNVSKASGIRLIAEQLDIKMDSIMMIGDGHNDLDAMKTVGHPVAMGNAVPELKKHATHVVSHVDEDGVVEALALSLSLV